ncbi:hypothetical protein CRV08_02040 [Halarcobacter ebronensis]|uniref:Uncharacterized protein n=1 Tax=Halarcobacter ebronensis TaxID=1462615 RepID=A0A4Q0YFV9_9BACT|nr:hypothetical protein [Halarcobacter ebronensis]RXJ69506.1 hypothetical protein CRV08_02040 [Halarcobacter ebronensis]
MKAKLNTKPIVKSKKYFKRLHNEYRKACENIDIKTIDFEDKLEQLEQLKEEALEKYENYAHRVARELEEVNPNWMVASAGMACDDRISCFFFEAAECGSIGSWYANVQNGTQGYCFGVSIDDNGWYDKNELKHYLESKKED